MRLSVSNDEETKEIEPKTEDPKIIAVILETTKTREKGG